MNLQFNGLIEDKFIPVMQEKAKQYGCDVIRTAIVPDDRQKIAAEVQTMKEAGKEEQAAKYLAALRGALGAMRDNLEGGAV